MKKIKATITFLLAFFSISKIPIAEGKTNFTDEQLQQLSDKVGAKTKDQIIKALDKHATEIAASDKDDAELAAVRAEVQALLQDSGLSEEEATQLIDNEGGDEEEQPKAGGTEKTTVEMLQAIKKSLEKRDRIIEKLMKEPEPDTPLAKGSIKREDNLEHSATHFLGRDREIDAFADRPWNQRAAGLTTKQTDWAADGGSAAFEKLKSDMYNHYTEVNDRIKSLHRDMLKLPAYFRLRSNVSDRVADGNIATAEITQARKAGWLPKNKQLIQPEEGKVFPVHIDIEWEGIDLQEYETSWLNAWSKPGSSPYKMSFVEFLLVELDKKARVEDRKVAIAGIHSVPRKGEETKPGDAINRGDGLLIHLFRAFHYENKYKRKNIGIPTKANIVDYVGRLIEANMPEEVRNYGNVVVNLHPDLLRWYKTRYKQIHGTETGWKAGEEMTIENYPGARFEIIYDMPNPLYMFITFDDNVELMENLPKEKSIYRMDTLKRIIYVYADYKWGARFLHIGTKVKEGDPDAFKVQTVWDNGLPQFPDNWTVPVFDTKTGEVSIPYSNVKVDSAWVTDITDIKNTYPGQIVKIKGNTAMAAVKNVTSAGNMTLTANFNLQSGGTLTLYVNSDLTLTEVSRTTQPDIVPEVAPVNFDGDSINAQESNEFNYTGATNQTLAAVENGIDGQEITINGNATANATLTVTNISAPADGESAVSVKSDAALAVAADYITLVRINGVFTEVKRNITAF